MSSPLITLSPSIRDWVVLPMLLLMILTMLLRAGTGPLLRSAKAIPAEDRKLRSILKRVSRLRSAGGFLHASRWSPRRSYWSSSTGPLSKEHGASHGLINFDAKPAGSGAGGAASPMNPAGAMEGMMGNASFMVQNMVMMQAIQHFFSGYVLVKIPFPLSSGFRAMFARGIDLPTLDASYVSSLSWYFIVMYGLRGVTRLLVPDPSPSTKQAAVQQMDFGMSPQVPQPLKPEQACKQEREQLEIATHICVMQNSERLLLGSAYPKPAARRKAGKRRG
eukprot:CAMPEP_0182457270 /NCGR_PEP_ID=MMETSP1319-20130603/2871_1 /TAXON_ID=172717 /ORGANISM="Bolidomonas pacifica, Strain RCC208" /LENGTH=276 /DNA_ID=CAMNT_0024655699 /DNA_START=129 /DNA_END=955 /DNA_ORIENTATION=+